jgi:chaperone required for assembly of F1-ATPase
MRAGERLNPTEAARQAMRPQLRRRFFKEALVEKIEGNFRITLDGRAVRTPAGAALALPGGGLAEAVASEWEGQHDLVNPAKMPLTRLANTIIDSVAPLPLRVAAEVERYLAFDLVLYRAGGPQGLVARQAAAWDPVLEWARAVLGARFAPVQGLLHVPQPEQALAAARAAIPHDPWRLGAVHAITTLTGSALIALALADSSIPVAQAWSAGHVDEDWNMHLWGHDEVALARRAAQLADMAAAAEVLRLV